MKQLKYSMLLLLLYLFGCGKEEIKNEQTILLPLQNEIRFSLGSISDSRATIMDNSNFVADGRTIGVYANKQKGNLSEGAFSANVMNNEELVYSNGIWSYSPMQFWSDNQDTLYSFVAYSPYTPFTTKSESGVKIPYVSSPNNEEQIDLLFATNNNINSPDTQVAFDFKHALSKVTFKISGEVSGADISRVDITDVKLSGIYTSATATLNALNGVCSWGDYSDLNVYNVYSGALTCGTEKIVLGEPMLLIPQTLDEVSVDVRYKVYKSDGTYSLMYSTLILPTEVVSRWGVNRAYVYNLNLTLKGVDFSVTVSDFEEQVNIPVDIPGGVDMPINGYIVPENAIEYVVEVDVDGYVDASDLYDVAHLVEGADANSVVKMAYLDEEGFMAWQDWTVTDGWFGAEGALYWYDETCFACIKPNADGTFATITCKSEIEVGTAATALLDYGNGVILAITLIVADLPTNPKFIAPVADYEIDIQVVQDNSYGATYFALDGTELGNGGAYSEPTIFVNPVADVSVDITSDIEVVLGLDDGTLENELFNGSVYMGAYNALNEFMDCREITSSNFFYRYDVDGSALDTYSGCVTIIDHIGFVGDSIKLYGNVCFEPYEAQIGETYSSYIVFRKDGENEYVVKINQHVVDLPERIQYQVVSEQYSIMYNIPYTSGLVNLASETYNLSSEMVAEIETLIGGEVDNVLIQRISDSGEVIYREYTDSDVDSSFGVDGPSIIKPWGTGLVCMRPNYSNLYEFRTVIMSEEAVIGEVVKCVYQYCCFSTRKAVNIEYIVTIVEPE